MTNTATSDVNWREIAEQLQDETRQQAMAIEGLRAQVTSLSREAWEWSKALEAVTSSKLTNEQIDAIAAEGMRNAAGGIYATSVYEFARAIERAAKSAPCSSPS